MKIHFMKVMNRICGARATTCEVVDMTKQYVVLCASCKFSPFERWALLMSSVLMWVEAAGKLFILISSAVLVSTLVNLNFRLCESLLQGRPFCVDLWLCTSEVAVRPRFRSYIPCVHYL